MKVTCGACFKLLRVEDWLADNVGRCPKCNQVIHIPPAGSPDGANAVVLTVEEASELLRRRAGTGQIPSAGPAADQPGTAGPRGPKTEPLPAFLRQAAGSIHEEPEQRKTRPLPRPVGRPSPALAPVSAGQPTAPPPETTQAAEQPEAPVVRRAGLMSPLVPMAFIAGLALGAVCGWWVGRPGQAPPGGNGEVARSDGDGSGEAPPTWPRPTPTPAATATTVTVTPPAVPTPTPTPTPVAVATPSATTTNQTGPPAAQTQPAVPATQPVVTRSTWLAAQPAGPKATIEPDGLKAVRRVAGIGDGYPANHLYYPAPLYQAYLEVTVRLVWQTSEPVTFKLAGPQADCWLVCRDGQVYEPLGSPRKAQQPGAENPVADPAARVTLDKSNPVAEVSVLFLVSEQLPPGRISFAGSQFADLPSDALGDKDPTGGRAIDGRWESVPLQLFAQSYAADQKVMEALARAGHPQELLIDRQGNGNFTLKVEKAQVTGALSRAQPPGYFDAAMKINQAECRATVRVFDRGRQLLIYLGPDKFMQFGFQRAEQNFFGL